MSRQRCMLCGRFYPTGLHILGCFLCFPCEKSLLDPAQVCSLSPRRRRRLAQWARHIPSASPNLGSNHL